MPEHLVGEAVRILLELPRQARLADAGDAGDADEVRAPALGGVEQILEQAQLTLPADERRVEPGAAADAAPGGRDAHGPPERHRLGLALERERPGGLADDRRLGHAPGRLVDEHGSGGGGSLDAGRGVDEIARDDALADRAHRHRRLAGGDGRPGLELETVTVAEGAHGVDELERDPDGPLGVVLLGDGGAPHRHDRVADELLDRAAVALDRHAGGVEVAGQKLAHLLGVARAREGGEADEIGEEHRDHPALGRRRRRRRGRRGGFERAAARAAEPVLRLVRARRTRRTRGRARRRTGRRIGARPGSRSHRPRSACRERRARIAGVLCAEPPRRATLC